MIGCAAVLALSAGPAAHAGPLVNGGFETGDFSGWTQFGDDTSFDSVNTGGLVPPPHGGTYQASFGDLTPGGISQTISTVIGQHYLVSFWLRTDPDPDNNYSPNSFDFSWGGVSQFSFANEILFNYTNYTVNLAATSTSTALTFTFTDPPSFVDLDDVTVSAVPEPDTLALLILAGSLAALRTRRRRVA